MIFEPLEILVYATKFRKNILFIIVLYLRVVLDDYPRISWRIVTQLTININKVGNIVCEQSGSPNNFPKIKVFKSTSMNCYLFKNLVHSQKWLKNFSVYLGEKK